MSVTWIFMNPATLEYLAIPEEKLTGEMRWSIEENGFELYSDACTCSVKRYMQIMEPVARKAVYEMRSVDLATAKTFVADHHRHHKAPQGHKFSLGLFVGGKLIGVIIVGRPVARALDDKETLEVTRCCVMQGYPNAVSKLYSAAIQAAKSLMYKRIITYTLTEEIGASMRAVGFDLEATTNGGSWNCKSRPRTDKAPTTPKYRWCKKLA